VISAKGFGVVRIGIAPSRRLGGERNERIVKEIGIEVEITGLECVTMGAGVGGTLICRRIFFGNKTAFRALR